MGRMGLCWKFEEKEAVQKLLVKERERRSEKHMGLPEIVKAPLNLVIINL